MFPALILIILIFDLGNALYC